MQNNVLIIDDSAVDRSIMGMIIRKNIQNVNIFESDDGSDFLNTILNHQIKVCILDLKMPGKDGFEVLSEMKLDPRTVDVPVIVCTGIMDTKSLERVLTLGAYDYFTKPLSEEAMKISLPLKVRNAIELASRTQYIVHLSQLDSLTRLYNRNYFKGIIKENDFEDQLPVSVLMVDINGLKVANDAYGSDVGDLFLQSAAKCIKENIPENALSARWGGDEFALLLPATDKARAEEIGKNIQRDFSALSRKGLTLTTACGWDSKTAIDEELSKIMSNAEDAMFRDKILEDVSIRSSMLGTILNTLHEKNPREEAHSRRVSELCRQMGEALQLSDKEVQDLKVMGLLHDIGKIAIDESILNKPGHLNHEEWIEMKRHPEIGGRLLSSSSEMQIYADIILCHHERLDGKGYPNGISGEEIPLHSRIIAIIDSYDAMTCERTYRAKKTNEEAAGELFRCSGTQFDLHLAEVFVVKVLGLPFR